jgi:hypothetical protein
MPAPTVRPPNPEHLRLIEDLLADPTKAMCPICGEHGFWDNREGKKNPKSPDYKCRNKACVGTTPMKAKQPYAVWLPDGFPVSAAPSKRVPSPGPVVGALSTREVQGAEETAQSLRDDPDGDGGHGAPPAEDYPSKTAAEDPPTGTEADPRKETRREQLAAYKALWRDMASFQREACQPAEGGDVERVPYDAASINASCSTLWIEWGKSGLMIR